MTNAFEKLYRGVQFQSSLQPTWAEQQSLEGYYRKEADELAKQRYQLTIENMELREKLREAERLAMLWMARYEHDKITPLGVDRLFKCESELAEVQEKLSKQESTAQTLRAELLYEQAEKQAVEERLRGITEKLSKQESTAQTLRAELLYEQAEKQAVEERLRGITEQLSKNTANLSETEAKLAKYQELISWRKECELAGSGVVTALNSIFSNQTLLNEMLKPLFGSMLLEKATAGCGVCRVEGVPAGALIAYTDGSFTPGKKEGSGGWGVVMFFNGGNSMEAYMRVSEAQSALETELCAVYAALYIAKTIGEHSLYIYHDNASVATDTKPKGVAKALGVSVVFVKAKAHSGDALNNRADKLAGTYKTNPLNCQRSTSHTRGFIKNLTKVTV